MPQELLKKNPDEMYLEEFWEALAQARYVEEILEKITQNGVAKAFRTEE